MEKAKFVNQLFELLAVLFDKIPFLEKFKGYRAVLGFIGVGVVTFLQMRGVGEPLFMNTLQGLFLGFTGLALNAKGRDENVIVIKDPSSGQK